MGQTVLQQGKDGGLRGSRTVVDKGLPNGLERLILVARLATIKKHAKSLDKRTALLSHLASTLLVVDSLKLLGGGMGLIEEVGKVLAVACSREQGAKTLLGGLVVHDGLGDFEAVSMFWVV